MSRKGPTPYMHEVSKQSLVYKYDFFQSLSNACRLCYARDFMFPDMLTQRVPHSNALRPAHR